MFVFFVDVVLDGVGFDFVFFEEYFEWMVDFFVCFFGVDEGCLCKKVFDLIVVGEG